MGSIHSKLQNDCTHDEAIDFAFDFFQLGSFPKGQALESNMSSSAFN